MAKRKGKPRVAVVVKRTAYDRARDQPADRMHSLLESGDPTVANVMAAHEEHIEALTAVKQSLAECEVDVTRIRKRSEELRDGQFDLVVTVGGDGTLLRTSQGVGATPLLGVNSAPSHSVGFFCGAKAATVGKAMQSALKGKLSKAILTRMQVSVNGQVVHQRVLNDALFCHQSPAATSRYIIQHGSVIEEQKSSGFWIGPAAGSTAAQRSAGGKVLPLTSKNLQCVVRELYTPGGEEQKLSRFNVKPGAELIVRSKARQMRLYLDGPDTMRRVGLGDVVVFTRSPEPLHLLGISVRRKWGDRGKK